MLMCSYLLLSSVSNHRPYRHLATSFSTPKAVVGSYGAEGNPTVVPPSRAPAPPQGAAPALGSPLCIRRARRLLPHRRAAGRAKLSEFRHYDELMTVHVKTCICNWHLQASEQRKKMIISNWKVPMVVNTCPAMLCVNFQSLDAMMTVHAE